jgi:hypothetical protein
MASVYTNLYYNQPIVVLDTTSATPTSGSLVLYGGFSARGASILSGITSIINSTESNDTSSGSLIVSGGVAIQKNLNVKGNTNIIGSITAASIKTTLINSTNGFFTNFTTSNFQADYVRSVAITSGAIIATQGTFSTVSSSFISVDTMSAGSVYLSGDLAVAGTITTVNITSTNLIQTNVTAGVVYVTDTFSAIGNSSTIGSIYTTGGNVGINTTEPTNLLDVNGTANFTDVLTAHKGITTGTLNVTGASLLSGAVTIGSNLIVSGPSLKIPVGNIANRPVTPEDGYVRYNTETSQFEGYGPGSAWGSLGGVVDIAQTTKILASASPSVTDGNLYFYTVGSERMRVNSAGNIGIGTTSPSFKLDVQGTLGASTSISTSNLYASNSLVTNTIDMTPSLGDIIKEISFSAQNNQLSVANITNLAFPNNTVRSFSTIISVCIVRSAGSNLYANFDIRGIQKDIGDWTINTNFIGDNTGIVFTISNVNSKGQIQYISEDLSNWVSTTFKFKATTTSI